MPPRLENRFRFLIEVSLGKGVSNLKGLKQKLDATSNSLRGVTRFLKGYGIELGVGKARLKTYVSSLERVKGAHTKLKEAQRALTTEQKKETLAVGAARAEYIKAQAALDALTGKENKSAAAKKRFSAATDKARIAQRQLVGAERAVGVQSGKAKDKLDKVARSFRVLAKEVNIGKERMVQLDRRTMKSIVQWKKLGNRIVLAKAQMTQFTDSSRRAERQSQRTAKSQDKIQSEFKQTTAAVKRAGREFQIWTDQRLTSSAIPALRRRLGALRNQLLVLAFATRGLVSIFEKAFSSSLKLESALKGLGSVAINTGAGMQAAQQAALALASKGLVDVADAAAGLKNLLSAGFGLKEAIMLMDTLTNSAAFNRQGTLRLGEAVVGATQGIKNQNCLKYDTLIYDPVRGETKTIEEWHDEGTVPCVLSVNRQTGEMEVTQAEYLHYNGENEVFEIELENGTTIEATANHRFLTQSGFKFLEDLDVENDVLYYVDEELVEEELQGVRNSIMLNKSNGREFHDGKTVDNDLTPSYIQQKEEEGLWNQDRIVKDVETLSPSTLLGDLGEEKASVKDAGLIRSMRSIDKQVRSIANSLKLDVKTAEGVLSLLEDVSREDLDYFALKFAERKISDENSLAKIALVIVEELKRSVRLVGGSSLLPPEHWRGGRNTVQGNVLQMDTPAGLGDPTIPDIRRDKVLRRETPVGSEGNISNGRDKYLSAIGYDVVDAVELAKILITRIIFSHKPNSRNGDMNSQMVSPFVMGATGRFTGRLSSLLKNSISCTPTPLRIVRILSRGFAETYDLSIPSNFNFVANSVTGKNSIMVDNAGITKNLSVMYKEYAAKLGTTMGRLTEVQKRQAIFNGILKEGAIFAGDAEKVLATLAGRLSVFSTRVFMAAASLGNVLKPGLEAMVNLFGEGANAAGGFFEKMEKSNSILRESRKIGQGFARALRDLVGVIGVFTGAIVKVISVTGGLAAWLAVAIKLSIALRIKRKLVSLFTVNVEKNSRAIKILTATERLHGKTLREGTVIQKVAILRMGNLTAQYRVTRVALGRLQARQVLHAKQLTGLAGIWIKLGAAVSKSLVPLKAAGVAFKRVGGAAVIAGVALRGFLASLGPILIAFLAFEGVLWIIDRIFGAAKRAREMAKVTAEMTTQLGAYRDKLREVQRISAGSEGAAGAIGLDLLGGDVGQLRSNLARLSAFHSKIEKLTDQFSRAKTAKSREAIREQIEVEKEGFDKIINLTREAHVRIEQAVAGHHQARADIQALFKAAQEKAQGSTFDKAIRENDKMLEALIAARMAIDERRKRATDQTNSELVEDFELLTAAFVILGAIRDRVILDQQERTARGQLRIARRARSEQIRLLLAEGQLGVSKDRLISIKAEEKARHELAKIQTKSINLTAFEETILGTLLRAREKLAALRSQLQAQRKTEIADQERAMIALEARLQAEQAHLKGLGEKNEVNAKALEVSGALIGLYKAEIAVLVERGIISEQIHKDELARLEAMGAAQEKAARLTALAFAGRQIDAAVSFVDNMARIDEQKIANKAQHTRELDQLLADGRISEAHHAALSEKARILEEKRAKLLREKERLALRTHVLDVIALFTAKQLASRGGIPGLIAAAAVLGIRAALRVGELRDQRDLDRRIADLDKEFKGAVSEATGTEETARKDREAARKLGGTIKAQNLDVTISPTIVIQGEQIFIGQGSIGEFGAELQALLLSSMQSAIDRGEIDLSTISNMQQG